MIDSLKMTFSEFLRERRKKLKITQEEAAKKIGYKNRQHIYNIENGQSFSMELGIRLAKAYGIPKKTVKEFLVSTNSDHISLIVDGIYKYE